MTAVLQTAFACVFFLFRFKFSWNMLVSSTDKAAKHIDIHAIRKLILVHSLNIIGLDIFCLQKSLKFCWMWSLNSEHGEHDHTENTVTLAYV